MRIPSPRADARSEREESAARRLAQLAADLGHDTVAPDHWPGTGAPGEAEAATSAAEEVAPSPVSPPPPGRHAARRTGGRTSRWRTRVIPGLGMAHLALLALIVALALAGTTWWVLRDRATPVPTSGEASGEPSPLVATQTPAAADTAAAAAGGEVTVDVTGKVRRPGIVVLEEGARVVDAVEAAGGTRRGVKSTGVNLARVLTDGEQIVVGPGAGAVGGPAHESSRTPVNLNLADSAALEELPGVGPVTAASIIEWREQHGGFRSVEQLIDVSGIGEKTLAELAPHVTV